MAFLSHVSTKIEKLACISAHVGYLHQNQHHTKVENNLNRFVQQKISVCQCGGPKKTVHIYIMTGVESHRNDLWKKMCILLALYGVMAPAISLFWPLFKTKSNARRTKTPLGVMVMMMAKTTQIHTFNNGVYMLDFATVPLLVHLEKLS